MRKFIGVVALAAIALSTVVFIGSAAGAAKPPNKPQITFTDPASDGGLLPAGLVTFTYNRTPKATKTLTCTTSGPNGYSSSGCGTTWKRHTSLPVSRSNARGSPGRP